MSHPTYPYPPYPAPALPFHPQTQFTPIIVNTKPEKEDRPHNRNYEYGDLYLHLLYGTFGLLGTATFLCGCLLMRRRLANRAQRNPPMGENGMELIQKAIRLARLVDKQSTR